MKGHEVIIVGAGSARVFATLGLSRLPSAEILMIEKGQALEMKKDRELS